VKRVPSTCKFYKYREPELNRKNFGQFLTVQVDCAGVFEGTCRTGASSTVVAGSGKCNPILAATYSHLLSVVLIKMLDIYGH
jgi:hypothetical protein